MSIDCQSCFDHEQNISQIYADFERVQGRLERAESLLSAMKSFGRKSWVLQEFLRHCYEAKSSEYHALDYVVMSRKRYEEVMEKAYPKKRIEAVWIDEASE